MRRFCSHQNCVKLIRRAIKEASSACSSSSHCLLVSSRRSLPRLRRLCGTKETRRTMSGLSSDLVVITSADFKWERLSIALRILIRRSKNFSSWSSQIRLCNSIAPRDWSSTVRNRSHRWKPFYGLRFDEPSLRSRKQFSFLSLHAAVIRWKESARFSLRLGWGERKKKNWN